MNIVMIGSGNAAAILGRKLRVAGHHIAQVWSRHPSSASALAYEWDTESTNYYSMVLTDADVYIVAVSDNAIADVAAELRLPGRVVAHTAASVPAQVLAPITEHYGVFYPLQSLRKETGQLPDIPMYFDGVDEKARRCLQQLAADISVAEPVQAGDIDRQKLHVAAVLANNFVNYLYSVAEDYCRKEGIDFKQLVPLIQETAARLNYLNPSAAQTGPAIRHDRETIEKHLQLLEKYPAIREVYGKMTEWVAGKL